MNIINVALLSILSLFIGSRGLNIGTDTPVYSAMFDSVSGLSKNEIYSDFFIVGIIFSIIFKVGSFLGGITVAFVIISFLTLFVGYIFCDRLARHIPVKNPLSLLCCYLASFYIINQQINVLKFGLASVFLLNYYISVFEGKKISILVYAILALCTHFTSIFGIVFALVAKYLKIRMSMYYLLFFVSLFLSYLNFGILNISIFNSLDIGGKEAYLTSDSISYQTGFRIGFALFNSILFGIFIYFSSRQEIFVNLLKIYILFSCLFFLCFQIPYSDRIGAFSWNLIPFILIIGVYNNKRFHRKALIYSFTFLFLIRVGISIIT